MGKSKYVVTITRQFGSMGRPIAKKMAEKLGIEYYDRDIVDQAAKKLNLPVSVVDEVEETAKKVKVSPFARMMFPLGKGTSNTQDKIFEAQQNIIKFLAEKETCIIVGRCADFTLEEMENAMHPYELPQIHYTVVRVAKGQMGIGGDDSWGAYTHQEYLLNADGKMEFSFSFKGI